MILVVAMMIGAGGSCVSTESWDIDFTVEAADTYWTLTAGVHPWTTASYDIFYDFPYIDTPFDSAAMWKSFERIFGIPLWLVVDRKDNDGVF